MPTQMVARSVPRMGPSVIQSTLAKMHSIVSGPARISRCGAPAAPREGPWVNWRRSTHFLNDIGLAVNRRCVKRNSFGPVAYQSGLRNR